MSDPIIEFLQHYLGEEEHAARSAIEAGEPIWYSPYAAHPDFKPEWRIDG